MSDNDTSRPVDASTASNGNTSATRLAPFLERAKSISLSTARRDELRKRWGVFMPSLGDRGSGARQEQQGGRSFADEQRATADGRAASRHEAQDGGPVGGPGIRGGAVGGPTDEIALRFRAAGARFERAKAVADYMGMDVATYLYRCIEEGHQVLKARQLALGALYDELEVPAYLRRADRDLLVWPASGVRSVPTKIGPS